MAKLNIVAIAVDNVGLSTKPPGAPANIHLCVTHDDGTGVAALSTSFTLLSQGAPPAETHADGIVLTGTGSSGTAGYYGLNLIRNDGRVWQKGTYLWGIICHKAPDSGQTLVALTIT